MGDTTQITTNDIISRLQVLRNELDNLIIELQRSKSTMNNTYTLDDLIFADPVQTVINVKHTKHTQVHNPQEPVGN